MSYILYLNILFYQTPMEPLNKAIFFFNFSANLHNIATQDTFLSNKPERCFTSRNQIIRKY